MSRLQSEGFIYISSITLNVRPQFDKTVDHIVFKTKTGSFKREIPGEVSPGHEHKEQFDPALKLSVRDQLSVSVQYRSMRVKRTLSIAVELREVVTKAQDDRDGTQRYFTFHKNIEVAIGISRYPAASGSPGSAPLPSTTSESSHPTSLPSTTGESSHDAPLPSTTGEILSICPRFRLLIIGNSGVGKSTLIQKVFGVRDVDVSESSRGRADIDREFVAADNGLFVLHDSLGLEAGESDNFDKVKTFIGDRRKKENLKDRLHAVWVCLAVPYAKGRLLEAGMENFLRERRKILGDIPIVVVLTKLDLLDSKLLSTLRGEGVEFKTIEEAKPHLEPRRTEFLNEYCKQPLVRAAKDDIPHVSVSTKSGYRLEPTISELVKITTSEIERYIKADPSYTVVTERPSIERDAPYYIAGMAQRASIEANVDLTIALGKKRYWRNLGASLRFSSEKVKQYLLVIHQDIIQVWNFNDPEMALQCDDFKAALLDTSNLGVQDIRDIQTVLGSVTPLVSALAPLINELIGVAIALPIAGAVVLAQFCHEIYRSSQTIVKRFMAYIADLIYVMKILFILAPQGSITSQDVALALEVYKKSTYRNRVHLEIGDFSATLAMLPGGRDAVVEKIEVLIRRYNITDEEVSRLRTQINPVALGSS